MLSLYTLVKTNDCIKYYNICNKSFNLGCRPKNTGTILLLINNQSNNRRYQMIIAQRPQSLY